LLGRTGIGKKVKLGGDNPLIPAEDGVWPNRGESFDDNVVADVGPELKRLSPTGEPKLPGRVSIDEELHMRGLHD
jgi:hypothetical protein